MAHNAMFVAFFGLAVLQLLLGMRLTAISTAQRLAAEGAVPSPPGLTKLVADFRRHEAVVKTDAWAKAMRVHWIGVGLLAAGVITMSVPVVLLLTRGV